MSEPKKIVDLKQYASKLLSEIEEEIKVKSAQIERLNKEVKELAQQKEAIIQILEKIKEFEKLSTSGGGVKVEAKVEVSQPIKPEPAVAPEGVQKSEFVKAENPSNDSHDWSAIKEIKRTEDKKWEAITVNNVDYARYYIGKSVLELEFKFKVPADSKYVKGFIIDKYLKKLKEESEQRGEQDTQKSFRFEVGTTENGEITSLKIYNFTQEQLQDLLNKIRWFVASEVRDLKAKGRLS